MKRLAVPAMTLLVAASLAACQSPQFLNAPVGSQVQAASNGRLRVNRVDVRVQNPELPTVPGEYVVRYKPGAASQTRSLARGVNMQVSSIGNPNLGMELVKFDPNVRADATLESLRHNPNVLYVEPNYVEKLSPEAVGQPAPVSARAEGPNDPMFAQQYAHQVSNSVAGWQINQGSDKVVLAIVDTGVDLKHPDLAAKIVPGRDIVDGDDEAMDGHYHGTHCAGIAAAMTNNGVGVAGFAPNVKIMPVRVLDSNGSGTSADVAAGIIWAADHGANVISMSLGSSMNSAVKEEAVKYALSKDIVVVAAMGNRGDNSMTFPGAQAGVIAVGATDNADKRASFSQYGKWISVSAPGVGILSTFPTYNTSGKKDYGSISGTSMATPAVAGVVALIRSQFPTMNREQVRAQLEHSVDDLGAPGFDDYYGFGRINVAKALTPARF